MDNQSDDDIDPFARFDPDKIKGAEKFRLEDIDSTSSDSSKSVDARSSVLPDNLS